MRVGAGAGEEGEGGEWPSGDVEGQDEDCETEQENCYFTSGEHGVLGTE